MSLLLIEVQSSGYLDTASLCVKVVLLFEEAGNYCSERLWKEMSWFCILVTGDISCLEPYKHVSAAQWWRGHTKISFKQKSPFGEVKLCGLYSFPTCILLSEI